MTPPIKNPKIIYYYQWDGCNFCGIYKMEFKAYRKSDITAEGPFDTHAECKRDALERFERNKQDAMTSLAKLRKIKKKETIQSMN